MISARNQINATVKTISRGIVSAEVVVTTVSGLELSSMITVGSCVRMDLQPGQKVVMVIKASDVMVAVGDNFAVSTRNKIPGTISKIISGPISDEIIIDANGTELVSVITETSVKRLGLEENTPVFALIKASNVIVMKG